MEKFKILFNFFVFLMFLSFSEFVYGEREENPNFKEVKTGAVAVADQGAIFSEPTSMSSKIGKYRSRPERCFR